MKSNKFLISCKSWRILILLSFSCYLFGSDRVSLSELEEVVAGIPRTKGYIIKDKAKFSAFLEKQQDLTFKQLLETPDLFSYEHSLEIAKIHASRIFDLIDTSKSLRGLWKSELVWPRENTPIWRFHFFVSKKSQKNLNFDEMDIILIDVFYSGECLPFLQDFETRD